MNIEDRQRERLIRIIGWAKRIRDELQPLQDAHGDRVHFRPSSSGFSMVGLLDEAPQLGKSGLTNPVRVVEKFEELFRRYCTKPPQKPTREKTLQSYLIRDAYAHERNMCEISKASQQSSNPAVLTFVTDEISLPISGKEGRDHKTTCDVLALRSDPTVGSVPIVMELKYKRAMKELIKQTTDYANLIETHTHLFEELYSVLLGKDIHFTAPAEKWAVWPAGSCQPDPHLAEFWSFGIRLVSFERTEGDYTFHVGDITV